ncbi:MAG: sensor domain-containing diguanylate cyclase [Actinobacteria bacterium]|nr:sensor domain-containing diguanylate cyclase [Actinomycetota bacterium]MBW3641512.1 sensor domain-containing diguanylate cyclase [Actinomycetota bacterium]
MPTAGAGSPPLSVRGRLTLATAVAVVLLPLATLGAVLAVDIGYESPLAVAVAAVTAIVLVVVVGWRISRRVGAYVEELERSRTDFRLALSRLGKALESSDDRRVLLDVVLETTQAILGAEAAVFFADAGNQLVAKVARGISDVLERRIAHGVGLAGGVAASGEAARWPADELAPAPPEPVTSTAMAVPLHAAGHLFGVLGLYGRRRPFSAEDLDVITEFARQAQASIDRTFLHEEARRLSITDGLTGLWNRRHLDLRCSEELDRAARFGEEFALVMCDLDDFSEINNRHGHQVGDAVLVEVSNRLASSTRQVDLVARYGGEEFVLLLPRTDRAGALEVAEKVRTAVGHRPIATDAGPLSVTVSLGVACHPDDGTSVVALVAAADAALYRAKAAGKNQVCVAVTPEREVAE